MADVIAAGKPACELLDGTLVRRPQIPFWTSVLSVSFSCSVLGFVRANNLGIVTNTLAPKEIRPGTVRVSDVVFTSWGRLPGRRIPRESVAAIVPDITTEFLREGHTAGEMSRKRGEYFRAGVRLVWEIDPRARTVRVYTAADESVELTAGDTLTGGDVLPGFVLPLGQLFAEPDRHG